MQIKWILKTSNQTLEGTQDIAMGRNSIRAVLPSSAIVSLKAYVSLSISEDEKIFMNGYQTWTVCGEYTKNDRIRGMHRIPSKLKEKYGFDRYGDYHFIDYPFKKGITHGESWCYFRKGDLFRLFASVDERLGYTLFQYDAKQNLLTLERDSKDLKVSGERVLFDFYYGEGNENKVFDEWFALLNLAERKMDPIAGYSSWYNRYQDISEETIRKDLDGCRQIFEKDDLFQIDDGWEPFVGDWLETDAKKFPHPMKQMVDEIHASGFKAGLWLAPFVAEKNSRLYAEHQDWFLKVNGENWNLGSNWSGFYSLDIDHPEVKQYLKKVFTRVKDEWGFDLVKLDFLYGAAPFGSAEESRAARMIRAMQMLREWCGDMQILGCGVPVMPAFGYVDYCRISCDVSLDWDDVWYMRCFHRERVSTKNAITNIVSRRQLNRRAYGSDPDVFFLRNENIKLTAEQKDQLARLDALLGNAFLTSDDPGSYTKEMKEQYQTYRHLRNATILSIEQKEHLFITYELDGKTEVFELTLL